MAAAEEDKDETNHTDGPSVTVNQPTSTSTTPIVLGPPPSSPTHSSPTEKTELRSSEDPPPSYSSLK